MLRTTLVAVFCFSVFSFSPLALAFEPGELLIWINADKGAKGLAEVGERFTRDTGIPVRVETPKDLTAEYDHVAYSARAPDIVIWPHDRFGSWINEGFLAEVTPSDEVRQAIAPFAWRSVSVGDRTYGYPIAVEVVSLLYNRNLIDTPPDTLKELAAIDRRLRARGARAIAWDFRNVYFSWPVVAGSGGYSFGLANDAYDLADVGVATDGAVAAVAGIRRLMDQGVLEPEDDYGRMMTGFKEGRIAMIINGPWAWSEIRDAGIPLGIANVPTATGAPGRPFVGVLAAGISEVSPNREAARRFLEDYLLSDAGLNTVNNDKPLGAVAHLGVMDTLGEDALIRHTFESASRGEMMPNVPEMKRFWSLMTNRFERMLVDGEPVRETLLKAATRLERLDQLRGWTRRHYVVDAVAAPEDAE
ncbi:maltose/maltodextrin ABC transporter substrate-binding protein MalE [Marinobacter sp. C2H3]|uniref:maltose/maltodextrin ABC transporter substrate-binding protein MalE n=1 Tax=Marinobacter sp. C2H3 TaxID=3119003 RepID=UPI00300E9B9F